MQDLIQDLRFAARQLTKEKAFVAAVTLTLALCIGANAAIFSVVNSVVLRPLPFPEPERLVTMWNSYPGAGVGPDVRGSNGAPDYFDRRALTEVFAELASYRYRGRTVEMGGVPQRLTTREVTPSFFRLLHADAALGRTFTEEEQEPGGNQVVLLSHGLWQQLFGGDTSVLSRELRVDGRPHTIVGVMPEDFVFLDETVRLWTPLAFTPEQRRSYHSNSWNMLARLQPGVTLEQAQERVDALNSANLDKMPEMKPLLIDAGFHTPLRFFQEDLVRDVRDKLYLLWGGVSFVLLIGCVNVANLVLVRSTARARELATRFALGASRRRVVRQVLTEILLLTVAGGALGLLLGHAGLRALETLGIGELPRGGQIQIDRTAVAFTLGLALVVAVLVSLIPLASVMRVRLTSVFREEGRSGTAGRGTSFLRKTMVAAQVALALILLVGAGLLTASFRELMKVDPGFEPRGVLSATVVLTESGYPEDGDVRAFTSIVLERILALPGVERAGITSHIPFGESYSDSVIFAEGYVMQPGESAISPTQSAITPGYLEAMDIRIVEGRAFDERDTAESRPGILVDERLANRFWPKGNALGQRMWMPDSAESFTNPESAPHFDIVGIVEPIQMRDLTSTREAIGAYYFPMSQSPRRTLDLAVKTSTDPHALVEPIRRAVAELDPNLALFDIYDMMERIDRSVTDRRTPMLLAAGFGVIALLLAAVGIYGMLAYLVQLRTRELGIRMALGSDRHGVFGLVLRDGLAIVLVGLAVGSAGALSLRRFIESQLYGVSPLDPGVIATVVGLLAFVALCACLVPARRATSIDPVRALVEP